MCFYPWWFHPTEYHQSAYRQHVCQLSAFFVAASRLFSTGDLITSWHRWHLVYLSVVHTCGAVCLDLQMAYKKAAYCHFGHAAGSHLGM